MEVSRSNMLVVIGVKMYKSGKYTDAEIVAEVERLSKASDEELEAAFQEWF